MMKTKAQSHKMIVTVLVILISCFFVNTVNCNPQGNNTRKQQERAILVNSVDDERGFIFLKKKLHDQNDVILSISRGWPIMELVNLWGRPWNMLH